MAPALQWTAVVRPPDLVTALATLTAALQRWDAAPLRLAWPAMVAHIDGVELVDHVSSPEHAKALRQAFIAAASKPMRIAGVTLTSPSIDTPIRGTAQAACATQIGVSWNRFPDDPVAVTVCVHANRHEPWPWLAALRDALTQAMPAAYLHSVLGYAFLCDPNQWSSGVDEMERLCMRYLGVDLDDSLSIVTMYALQGIRNVGWQVQMSTLALERLSPDVRTRLTRHARHAQGLWLWQSGAAASMCDRNDPAQEQRMREHAALDALLEPLKSSIGTHWIDQWKRDPAQWPQRWNEWLRGMDGVRA